MEQVEMLSMVEDPRQRARDIRAKFFPRTVPVAAVRRGAALLPPPPPPVVAPVIDPAPPPEVATFDPKVVERLTDRAKARTIITDTCRRHGVKEGDFFAQIRDRRTVAVRAEAYWLITHHTKLSSLEIGRIVKRDHSSVSHLVKRASIERGPAR